MNYLRISIAAAGLSLASYAFAADVDSNWTDKCASCHGKDGQADTKMGKKLKHPQHFTDAKYQADPSPMSRP
jgi:cytochrome c553